MSQAQEQAAATGAVTQYLASRGIYNPEQAELEFRLGQDGNWMTIPYLTPTGIVGIKRRYMGEGHEPKCLAEPGSGIHLYNAQVLLHADKVIVCEGELDAIAIQMATGWPAVGIPGAPMWGKPEHAHWRLCFEGVHRLVVADGDEAGREMARKASADLDCRWVEMPDGEDPGSYLQRFGVEAFKELIRA